MKTAFILALLALAACDSSPIEPSTDDRSLTVDAAAAWAFVRLGDPASQVVVASPETSSAWDIAFNATRVMLNGGAAGPGSVVGHCLCQNASATDAQVQAMTPQNQRAVFDAVTLADVPTSAQAWDSDALDPAIAGWYAYDMTTHQVNAVPTRVWQLRGAGSDPEYAKLHVTQLSDATQAGANVTLEYAVQAGAGEPFGAVQTVVLDGRGDPVYFDVSAGAVSADDEWDIMLDGYAIRVNGGVSGSGGAGAVLASESFAELTDASDAPAQVYRGDAFGGVFTSAPWYRYDLDGNHTIFPTYDVYLIDTGTDIYKLQVTGYYSTTGQQRHITFRYERLDG